METTSGHAFISYVREDAQDVDHLQQTLEAAGISVWRDTANLWPGEDWRRKIRDAITNNALVFIACFSSHSAARAKSYQNEELLLAIDQLRQRRPDDPWLIPVRFDDCPVPDFDLDGGRTLASIQRVDLFGEYRDGAMARLVAAVQRLLGQRRPGQDTRERENPTSGRPAAIRDVTDHGIRQAPSGRPSLHPAPPLITDRWRLTTDGHEVPALMQLRNNSMSHPGYTSRPSTENPPPSMRIGVVVPCGPLGSTPATSDIRASFLNFLHSQPFSDLLAAVTATNLDAAWTARDGRGRFNFGAVLDGETDAAPVAWARLLLPQADTSYYGYYPPSAVFILHIYPRTHDGSPAPAANLATWHERFVLGLAFPSAVAAYLTQRLGLATTGGQPAQAGVYLDAPHSMTELVDTEGLTPLPGSSASNWFMGWAISDPDGHQAASLAREWLTQMCDNTLYLDGYESHLEVLTNPRQAPADPVFTASQVPTIQDTQLITAEVAVQRLKQALPDPARRIEVSDLIDREIQQLASRIADTARHPLSGVPFADQRATYEEESATSARLLATGVFHGDEVHTSLWGRSLRRLMSARRPTTGSFNGPTEAMRHYPALLCLWAMGISAILADRENLLARFLLEPKWTPIFGKPEPQPAVYCLNPIWIVAAEADPDDRRWLYPQSHHMRAASRDALRQIEPDDDTYKTACDRLEYLASVLAMGDKDVPTHVPWEGEFMLCADHLDRHSNLGNFLAGGAFDGSPERARAAHEALATWIAQHGRW